METTLDLLVTLVFFAPMAIIVALNVVKTRAAGDFASFPA